MNAVTIQPRFGFTGSRFEKYALLLEETFADTGKLVNTSKEAVAVATLGVVATVLARIGRAEASELFHAVAAKLKNVNENELDKRRIDKAASALFAAAAKGEKK